jgi:hypothetical protein
MAEKEKDIIARAQDNFKSCLDWEALSRQRFKEDMRFLFADSDNQDQWEPSVKARRHMATQPMITINKVHTHWLMIVNQMKENKPSIQVHPTNGEASYEAAQIYEGLIRHIEYKSNAKVAYDIASEQQVGGGIGYVQVITKYADDSTFDQEIYIKEIPDALSVYLDPHIKKRDGSDAKYAFIYEDMPRKEFERKYPNVKVPTSNGNQQWVTKDIVKVATYYEKETRKEWLYSITNDDGSVKFMRESDITVEERKLFNEIIRTGGEGIDRRRIDKHIIRKYLIGGTEVLEKGIWPGTYIPIARQVGEEVIIEQTLDRKGIVRYMKDAQRAYNYNASAALEYGALQSKSPYLAPVEAINGLENYWATANTENHAYLPYNSADEQGNPVPTPSKAPAPSGATVYTEGMATANMEMSMASGQYEQTFGQQSQELSGVSIDKRIKQGNRATFHFQDSQANTVQFVGKIIIDLIPKIYDTKRIVRILGEDGSEDQIMVDPEAQQAIIQKEEEADAKVKTIFNPNVGKFDVVAECGPSYDTKRAEAFDSMTKLLVAQPALSQVIGDLYMGAADFPGADKLQERMRNWIPQSILGTGPSEQEQAMMQQLQESQEAIQALTQQLNEKQSYLDIEKQRADIQALNHIAIRYEDERQDSINAFKAETDRLKVILANMKPEQINAIAQKTYEEIEVQQPPAVEYDQTQFDPSQLIHDYLPNILESNQPQQMQQPQEMQQMESPQQQPQIQPEGI